MSSHEDERDHPPVIEADEGMLGERAGNWFKPPYSLDSDHSYFNDPESSYKLAPTIVTLADEEFLGAWVPMNGGLGCWNTP